ncbi:MAG: DUF3999 family protein [Cyclobacteriaceae bacterium]|nr:DUF3999 family protein [Cyclobacteriaceae bacterium]
MMIKSKIVTSMKTKLITLSLLFLIFSAQAQTSSFAYRRMLKGVDSAGWYGISLPNGVIQNCQTDFADLRIFQIAGADTTEAPYLLKVQVPIVTEVNEQLNAFNLAKKDGKQYLSFELKKDQFVNEIDLSFLEENYDGVVTVAGSEDQKDWFEVDRQRIISIHNENMQFTSAKLSFSKVHYRFIRLELACDRPLTFQSASFKNQLIEPGVFSLPALTWNTTHLKSKGQTVVSIDLKEYQLINYFSVVMNESNDFYRAFRLGRLIDSTKTQKGWEFFYDELASGYITSFTANEFNFGYAPAQKLRLTIYNGDNLPIDIQSMVVRSPQVKLTTRMKNEGTSFLYYGNERLAAPQYDLVVFKDKIPAPKKNLEIANEEKLLAEAVKPSALIENQIWLWGILGVVIAVLGYFTLKMMKTK